jgi:hypothetical protein
LIDTPRANSLLFDHERCPRDEGGFSDRFFRSGLHDQSRNPAGWLYIFDQEIKYFPKEANMVSREKLYELVWSIPMIKMAEKSSVRKLYDPRLHGSECSTSRAGVLDQTGSWKSIGSPDIARSLIQDAKQHYEMGPPKVEDGQLLRPCRRQLTNRIVRKNNFTNAD